MPRTRASSSQVDAVPLRSRKPVMPHTVAPGDANQAEPTMESALVPLALDLEGLCHAARLALDEGLLLLRQRSVEVAVIGERDKGSAAAETKTVLLDDQHVVAVRSVKIRVVGPRR